jgi:tetrahydrodipicolinate N-succinyltransferase
LLGCVTIGTHCILGANSTIKENIAVADSCVIGVGTEVTRNTKPGQVYVNRPPELLKWSSDQLNDWIIWTGIPGKMKTVSKSESDEAIQ